MPEALFLVRNSAGTVVFDSRLARAGCLGTIVEVPVSTAQTYTYPNHAGRAAVVTNLTGRRLFSFTVDYALGYPRVVFDSYAASTRKVAIWLV